ncbi:MAG: tetratricopeptide repeat protein [Acidimicrobiales bacterium]
MVDAQDEPVRRVARPEAPESGIGGMTGPMPSRMTGRFRRADSGVDTGSTIDIARLAPDLAAARADGERAAAAEGTDLDAEPLPPDGAPASAPNAIVGLSNQVAAHPGDVELRLRLARALLDHGDTTSAVTHISLVLQQQPDNALAEGLLQATMAATVSALRQPAAAPTARLSTF